MTKVYAVIPAFNEGTRVGKVIERTKNYVDKIVVVDDGSQDDTYEQACKHDAIVLRHIINMGLGFTLRTGCEKAFQDGADIIVTIDGDGQHDPDEISKLVKTLQVESLDIVFGIRPLDENMPLTKKFGNWLINSSSKAFFGIDMSDTQSGFRVFRKEAWEKLKWESSRYPVSSEIVRNTGRHKLKFKEVPIKTIYSDKFKGTTAVDGMKIFMNMLWWWIRG